MDKVYSNSGNKSLLALIESYNNLRILDIGCGAGDNARLLKSYAPSCQIDGITISAQEATFASSVMNQCWVKDVEVDSLDYLSPNSYDCIIFSHILEHFRSPDVQLERFCQFLTENGSILIALPNIVALRQRWQILKGKFEYQAMGVTDDTHLRFFTYETADKYLLRRHPPLTLVYKGVTGAIPLWLLRRYLLPTSISVWLDKQGCYLFPNLFGNQILLKLIKVRKT